MVSEQRTISGGKTWSFGQFLRAASSEVKVSKLLTSLSNIVLPAALGLITNRLSSVMDKLADKVGITERNILLEEREIFWKIFYAIIGLQILFGLFDLLRTSTTAEALSTMATLEDGKAELNIELVATRSQRDRYRSVVESMKNAMAVLFASIQNRASRPLDVHQRTLDFEHILAGAYQMREKIFRYKNEYSLYNLAVYLYDPTDQLLKKAWRKSHRKIRAQNRAWQPGIGHIGQCFLQKQVIITPDLCAGRFPTMSEDDRTFYRSAAATPILNDGEAVGVFVVTSNEVGQFGKADENGNFQDIEMQDTMETFGHLLSVYWRSTQNTSQLNALSFPGAALNGETNHDQQTRTHL